MPPMRLSSVLLPEPDGPVIACPGSLMTSSHVLLPSSYLITDTRPEEYPTASVAGSNRPLHHDSDDTPIFSFDDDGNDDSGGPARKRGKRKKRKGGDARRTDAAKGR